jgi:hypothetical protein
MVTAQNVEANDVFQAAINQTLNGDRSSALIIRLQNALQVMF